MRKLLSLCFFLLGPLLTFGQIENMKLYNISSDEGLPSDIINFVYQDSEGFLWMASTEGLIRWDGYNYRSYRHSESNMYSISNNIVYHIYEDAGNRLWVTTINGLNLYDREMDRFEKVKIHDTLHDIPVNDILEDAEGHLWLGTSYGLCRYDHEDGSYEWWLYNANDPNSLSHDVIFGLAKDAAGNIWIGTFAGGVNKFDPLKNTFRRFYHKSGDPTTICSNKIRSVMVDHKDQVWIGSYDQGVSLLDNEGNLLAHYAIESPHKDKDMNLVLSIYEDTNKDIWVASEREQLNYLDKKENKLKQFDQPVYKKNKLGARSISSFFEDTFGNFWFSSSEYGLYYSNSNKNSFRHYSTENAVSEVLNSNTITCFYESKDGTIWIGTDGGGITSFDKDKRKFKNYGSGDGLPTSVIVDIKEDKEGNLWLASINRGIVKFDPVKRAFTHYENNPSNPASLIYNNVKSLLIEDSIIWIGTFGEGLSAFDLRKDRFIHHQNNDVFPFDMSLPAWINHLFRDSKNRIWISTYDGVYVYDREKLRHYNHSEDEESISGNSVHMVAEDQQGRIWVASESGGLDRYDESKGAFVRYNKHPDLPLSFKGIVSDDQGKLWLSSNEGLVVFDPESQYVHTYDVSEGIQGNSFFSKSALKSRDGWLFFGGFNGFNMFHPDSIRPLALPSAFYFTELYIYNTLQEPGAENSVLAKPLQYTDTLVLSYDQAYFSIGFSGINLYSPLQTEYAYKLENFGNEWLNLKGERKVNFYNLEPGNYVFRIRYKGAEGEWVTIPKSLSIVVLPPWWQTMWFKVLVISVCVGLVLLFFYLKLAAVKRQKDVLAVEVKKRTKELREANMFLTERNEEIFTQNEKLETSNEEIRRQASKILDQQQLIIAQNRELEKTVEELRASNLTKDHFVSILAHDLKNPISAITGITEFLKDNFSRMDKKDVYEYMEGIHKSSGAVYDLLLNLLTWSMAQSGKVDFSPSVFNMVDLINKNLFLLEQQSANKNIKLVNQVKEAHFVHADYNMVDTVIRNIISNSIKFTEYNGQIVISANIIQDKVEIVVSDNGKGMSKQQLENLFEVDKNKIGKGTAGETGTGLGLVICKDFIERNAGEIKIESTLGEGTTLYITLPKAMGELPVDAKQDKKIKEEKDFGFALDFWEAYSLEKSLKLKGKRILIVDDSQEQRMFLKMLLYETFELFEARDGEEGMKLALEKQPHIIISDVMMPEVNGIEFCKMIRENEATAIIPVILLTSQTDEEHQLLGYSAGADVYLKKPVRKELLLQVLLNLLKNQDKIKEKMVELPGILPEEGSMNKQDEELINALITFIEKEISNPEIDSWAVAEAVGLSRTVLYERVKAITNKTLNDFIKTIRLKRSLKLLAEGKLSNSQIAFEVGFSSHSYFAKCFTKQFGVSPSKYIAERQKAAAIQK